MLEALHTTPLALVLEDLGLDAARVRTPGAPPRAPEAGLQHAVVKLASSAHDPRAAAPLLHAFAEAQLSEEGALLVYLEGARDEGELARWRDALWPLLHVGAIYSLSTTGIERRSLGGTQRLRGASGLSGRLLVARRRSHVLSPAATREKFDQNAGGWNTAPGQPGYAHYRWMRRYVGTFARVPSARRILDFGCGAGWVGIEAALRAPGAELCCFDPSPEMVRHAEENARESGIARCTGRVGFGEEPPFPAAGEERFDLVVCSGVISFSPDPERFLDGLRRALLPGGTLVIGDLQRESRGMRRRRARRALLPIRELNAFTPEELRPRLEERGLVCEAQRGYQFSWPLPQLMHANEARLGGALDRPLVWANAMLGRALGASAPRAFDSWVMRWRSHAPDR